MKKDKVIDSYSFGEFCEKVQEAILDGWRFDFSNNATYPTTFGSYYTVILVKDEEVAEELIVPQSVVIEEPQPVKKSRKSASSE